MNNRKMKVYKNVVVERIHTNLTFPETVPCYANFDYSNPIGVAILKYVPIADVRHPDTSAQIWADICLFEDKWTGAWPVLGTRFEDETQSNGTIMCLGICGNPNRDPLINPLSELNDPDFRIMPKDTPLEWGSIGLPYFVIKDHITEIKGVTQLNLCQCIIPEYLPNEHGDMTCIKCGHYPNPINPFANIL